MTIIPARILAIETATSACSAALYVDGEVQQRHSLAPRQHAALILPMVESLLASAELAVTRLDALAFGQGPGAFTGVRIAASVAQGIAFAANLPVVPVSTLAALAGGAMRESGASRVMAALDARMDEVYWGIYIRGQEGLPELQGQETVAIPGEVPMPDAGDWIAAGSGWQARAEILMARAGERVVRVLPDLEPAARDVALIAAGCLARGEAGRPGDALPVYLRDRVVRAPGV
jgi:tRNA threonylcarbamoyladenosine biosynthesis protein TsaB